MLDTLPTQSSCVDLSSTSGASAVAVMCSDEVEISIEIRPPDQFVDDSTYFPRAQPARGARIEPSTFRYAHSPTL